MNNKVLLNYFLAMVTILCFWSCSSYKTVPYFQNSDGFDGSKGARLYDMKIKPNDRLSIIVTSYPSDIALQFNLTHYPTIEDARDAQGRIRVRSNSSRNAYYLVDNDGTIDFPIIGKIYLLGKTIEQVN